ncbi:nitroreductase family protein [Lentzea sp. BCCO 10_0798]|uniref:Nitroreductase family protein n=1 Tax=Lentzea kristufekii TaxID=3095430 RepID=A0ABU4TL36_9PSEU|nr:nitroreductase family protein [Lentzea sp. BCCO 10_0798]MDX8048794.1 nitroreductase family protein [Lentzea sp. BCCO 10_0798]
MDALEAIMTTRAIRRFTCEPVAEDDVWTCLRAAQQAPSGGNVQPTRYLVVTDPDVRTELGKLYRSAFTRYTEMAPERTDAVGLRIGRSANHLADTLASVPVIVFFLMPRLPSLVDGIDIGPVHASVYPAVQNFCLAARALGLGTTLTTVIRVHHAETLELLGVPDRWEIAAMVPLGHPAERFSVAVRRDVSELTAFNRWS